MWWPVLISGSILTWSDLVSPNTIQASLAYQPTHSPQPAGYSAGLSTPTRFFSSSCLRGAALTSITGQLSLRLTVANDANTQPVVKMDAWAGLEPATVRLWASCSTT